MIEHLIAEGQHSRKLKCLLLLISNNVTCRKLRLKTALLQQI